MKTEKKLKEIVKLYVNTNEVANKIFKVFNSMREECKWMDEHRCVDFYCNHQKRNDVHCNIFDCPLTKKKEN